MSGPVIFLDRVSAELHRWAREPFDLGRDNCGLAVIAYLEEATGERLPTWLRLRLHGRRTARRLMRSAAAFERTAALALELLGCEPVEDPRRGDVGLVELPGSGLTACIYAGRGLWAARGERAAVLEPGRVRRAWRVPCPRR